MAIISAPAELPKATAPLAPQRQTNTIEPNLPAEAAPEEKLLSPQHAALARKEKALRLQAQQIKAERDALKAKESEYQTSYVSKADLQRRLAEDPMSVMGEYGLTSDQIAEAVLNQPGPESQLIKKLEAKIKALEEGQTKQKTEIEERQTQAYNQALNQIRNDAKLLIDSDASFETIKETNSTEAVVELIREQFEADGTLLSIEDAAKAVEEHLIEEAYKMSRLKKVQQRLSPPIEAEQPQPQKPILRTLTNAQTASTPTGRLTEKQRVERAKLAFKGLLK